MTLAAGCATALAAVPVGAVYTSYRWLWFAWAAVAAVTMTALGARALRLPAFLVPLAAAAGLLVYLTVVFASGPALFGIVPTGTSLQALRLDVVNGLADVRDLAAPVLPTPGLVTLTAGSIGAVAIVVDLIAVVLRRPAAAGLALLGLYAVPAAVSQTGVAWPLFVIGAIGYLVLLLVEGRDRLLRWGRPVGPAGGSRFGRVIADTEDAAPLTGQRIGAAAIAIAVVAPLLVPGLTANALNKIGRTGASDSTGGGRGVALKPFAALKGELDRQQPEELLRVKFTSAMQRSPWYIRSMVLERFNAQGWAQPSPVGSQAVNGSLTVADGVPDIGQVPFSATITITNLQDKFVPVYYAVNRVDDLPAGWQYDRSTGVVFSNAEVTGPGRYTISGFDQRPTDSQLRSSPELPADNPAKDWTGYPQSLPQTVRDTVAGIIKKANAHTPYERARALDDYFTDGTNGFTYSTQTQLGDSGSDLVDFLNKKQGFCQQYAAAMGIMLRVAGIPSRVVLGYTTGTVGADGVVSIGTQDAHAWVEAYFANTGWTPFDPTPLADGRTVTLPYAPHNAPAAGPGGTVPTGSAATAPGTGRSSSKLEPGSGDLLGSGGSKGHATGLADPRWALLAAACLLLLVLLAAPGLGRAATRRRRLRLAGGAGPPRRLARIPAWSDRPAGSRRGRPAGSRRGAGGLGRVDGQRRRLRGADAGDRDAALDGGPVGTRPVDAARGRGRPAADRAGRGAQPVRPPRRGGRRPAHGGSGGPARHAGQRARSPTLAGRAAAAVDTAGGPVGGSRAQRPGDRLGHPSRRGGAPPLAGHPPGPATVLSPGGMSLETGTTTSRPGRG